MKTVVAAIAFGLLAIAASAQPEPSATAGPEAAAVQPRGQAPTEPDWVRVYALWRDGKYAEAVALVKPAADAGSATAEKFICDAYGEGKGVPRDPDTALRYCTAAANGGDSEAMNELAEYYDKAKHDSRTSLEWLRRSADVKKNGIARLRLGLAFRYGERGLSRDPKLGLSYEKLAADQNEMDLAMFNVGEYYEYGIGTERNLDTALEYYRKAQAKNYYPAAAAIRRIEMKQQGSYVADDYDRKLAREAEADRNLPPAPAAAPAANPAVQAQSPEQPVPGPMSGPPSEAAAPAGNDEALMKQVVGQWRIDHVKPALQGAIVVDFILLLRPDRTMNVFTDYGGGNAFKHQAWGTYSVAPLDDGGIGLTFTFAGQRPDRICNPFRDATVASCRKLQPPETETLRLKPAGEGRMESAGAVWRRSPLP